MLGYVVTYLKILQSTDVKNGSRVGKTSYVATRKIKAEMTVVCRLPNNERIVPWYDILILVLFENMSTGTHAVERKVVKHK